MKKITMLLYLLAVLIGVSTGVCPAHAALRTVGPVSAVHGLPLWYQDVTGLSLQPCLDQTTLSPAGGILCILPGPPTDIPGFDPTLDPAANLITTTGPINATNFPGEVFYWIADAGQDIFVPGGFDNGVLDPATPVKFVLRMALEGNAAVAPGVAPLTFMRINLQKIAGGLVPGGVYTVSIPFGGTITFTANADGSSGGVGGTFAGQTFRNQIDATPPLFDAILPAIFPAIPPEQALDITMDNFLVWSSAAPAAPAGFIGDPNVLHPVVLAGTATPAVVQFSGTGLAAPVTITDFALAGKIIGLDVAPAGTQNFGAWNVGATSTPAKTFTITNLTGITTGTPVITPPAGFTLAVNGCNAGLSAGNSCSFDIAFAPTADGIASGNVTIAAAGAPTAIIPVTGIGDSLAPTVNLDPVIPITKLPSQVISGTVADNAGGAGVATVQVTSDGIGGVTQTIIPSGGTWLANISLNPNAATNISVTATDSALPVGNLSLPKTATIINDTIAPTGVAIIVSSPTKLTTQTITGTATDVNGISSVSVSLNGTLLGTATVTGDTWSFAVTGMTLNADNIITATATDSAGNFTSAAPITITVDTAPPALILNAVTALTNVNSQTITGTVEAGATVVVSTNTAATAGPVTLSGTGATLNWSSTISGLVEGDNVISVTATDAATNPETRSATVTLDTAPPTATISGIPTGPTKNTGATLTVAGTQVVSYQFKLDSGLFSADIPVATPITLTGLADGSHTVSVLGKDAAGNLQLVANAATVSWTVDTAIPEVAINQVTSITNVNSQTITGTVEAGATVVVTTNTAATASPVTFSGTGATLNWSSTISGLVEGANVITVSATDAATNPATKSATVTLDSAPPVVSLTAPANNGFSKDNTPLLTFSVTDATAVTNVVKVDDVVVTKLSGDTLALLSEGVHTVRVDSTDATGLSSFAVVSFTVDTVLPVISFTAPNAGLTKNNTPLLTFSVTDATAVTNIVKVDGTVVAKLSGNTLAQLADGPHTVRVESTDAAGNAVFAEVSITVDTTAPALNLNAVTTPTRFATQTISGTVEAGATVKVTLGNAAPADATVNGTTWSFDFAALVEGVNNITVTATDPAGNPASQQSSIKIVLPDGKINGGAAVSLADALKALQFSVGLILPTAEEAIHADVAPLVNGIPAPNGKVDIGDVVLVLRKLVDPTSW